MGKSGKGTPSSTQVHVSDGTSTEETTHLILIESLCGSTPEPRTHLSTTISSWKLEGNGNLKTMGNCLRNSASQYFTCGELSPRFRRFQEQNRKHLKVYQHLRATIPQIAQEIAEFQEDSSRLETLARQVRFIV
jgi:hypothetical protein